ncbi:hypothetical protein [Marinobacter sp. F4216]|uniref:hypothetical protein n=1 Tax=Marinobacter sp. F4216 TaxID=2874281 RepID=UPI001CBAD566|nr:hypothetical protein [Marinobacter sp. F4216]MBZ2167687.1 hypothetical protein [Marinobacter sp. F4216]
MQLETDGMKKVIKVCGIGCILLGVFLLLLNSYGLTKSLRVEHLKESELRFPGDEAIPFAEAMENTILRNDETLIDYIIRQTRNVDNALAHIRWHDTDPGEHNLRVPVWENYILFLMGLLSGIPEYKRYHFVQHEKSIERGIGICGDASMTLSTILTNNDISNTIVSFPGHVVVSSSLNGQDFVLDPDFGVVLNMSTDELRFRKSEVAKAYRNAGYGNLDVLGIVNILSQEYVSWEGPSHFISKKYYFEYFSYWFIWIFPVILLILGAWALKSQLKR